MKMIVAVFRYLSWPPSESGQYFLTSFDKLLAVIGNAIKLFLLIILMQTSEKNGMLFYNHELKNLLKESNFLNIRIHSILESGTTSAVKAANYLDKQTKNLILG